jgi:dihydrofolate reductase
MAELTLTTFLTLDGVMQAPGAPKEDTSGGFKYGGWLVPHFDADTGKIMVEIFTKADAFLFGRTTYDIFSAHWPRVTDPNNLIAMKLNSLPKYVASHTKTTFPWSNTAHIRDVIHEINEIKQRYSNETQVHGSCGLAQTLIQNDLIDEYRLLTFPVILGSGKRLFGTGSVPTNLKLIKSKTTSAGVVISVYRRGGSFKTGSFALD